MKRVIQKPMLSCNYIFYLSTIWTLHFCSTASYNNDSIFDCKCHIIFVSLFRTPTQCVHGLPVNSSHGHLVTRSCRHTVNSSPVNSSHKRLVTKLTVWRDACVTSSWPCDEMTVWRGARSKSTVNSSQRRHTRRSTRHAILRCDELTMWRVDWFPCGSCQPFAAICSLRTIITSTESFVFLIRQTAVRQLVRVSYERAADYFSPKQSEEKEWITSLNSDRCLFPSAAAVSTCDDIRLSTTSLTVVSTGVLSPSVLNSIIVSLACTMHRNDELQSWQTTTESSNAMGIHRVKWRHISVVAIRSPFCR